MKILKRGKKIVGQRRLKDYFCTEKSVPVVMIFESLINNTITLNH